MNNETRPRAIALIGLGVIGLAASVLACASPGTVRPDATSFPGPMNETATAISAQLRPTGDPSSMPMVKIPAGEFIMGSTRDQVTAWNAGWKEYKESSTGLPVPGLYERFSNELPQLTVYLDDFEIDQYEVSVAQYRRCVAAGVCEPPESEYTPYSFDDAAFDDYPVVGVLWGDAQIYCAWVGKRLPTEAEWEKAARGTDGRTYPWGDEWDPSRLQIHYTQGEGFETAPVGSYLEGASPYGVLDIAGNAPEWTNNPYRPYPGGQLMERIEGEHNLFVARGGYHGLLGTPDPPEILYRAADRFPRNDVSGFRCARGAAPSALEKAIVRSSVPTPPPTLESVSLAGMIEIPASEFEMGSDLLDLRDTSYHSPAHVVYLDTFYIDRYEATEAQYAAFLNALGQHLFACDGHDCILLEGESRMSFSNPSHIRKVGTQYVVDPGYEDYPVNRVYWYGAQAYCHWLSKRLPTEAEWEKAARGTDGRLYPWGNEWDVEKARYGAPLQPVGSDPFDVSPYGVIDMLGSVKEWVFDWYDPDYYTWSPTHNPWGPAEPGEHERKAARPGIGGAELVSRGKGTLDGFRCAYTP